ASTAAFAEGDDAEIYTNWDMYNSIYVSGDVTVSGTIDVDSEAAALVDQDQSTSANLSLGDGDNSAAVDGNTLEGASGNLGVNVAAGVGNVQANDTALAASDGRDVFASAMVFSSQSTGPFNVGTDFPSGPDAQLFYDASVGDSALAGASGNIGLNVASGVGNAQGNALAASINESGNIAKASSDSEQTSVLNVLLALSDLDNTASLGGSALSGAVGNIGVNVAAGVGNAQHNGLAISIARGD
ncbi:MAG: hypothetical protein M3Q40_00040, partial [Pseudomonadota bacterium]|nr:hypothetical protein [Pseudomonadota bacterium]